MKNLILTYLLVGISGLCMSQTITINDAESNQPLEMVSLASENPKAFVITNVQGQADISAFINSIKIEIRLLGYKTETKSYEELRITSAPILLKRSGISMDAVVISATRWNQNSRDIPARISMITEKEATLYNPQTAADLLGSSGEVFIQKSQQGGGSPMIRGFSTNRLLYTVDGVRMNTAIFRSGNLQNVISLDPFAIEKSEILFGPGSVIYGSDAIGGVMSFQTLTPQFSFSDKPLIKGKAVTRYSTANNEKTAHFDINVGWKKWSSVSSISVNAFDHLRMGRIGPNEYLRPFYVQRIDSIDEIVTNDDPRIQKPSGYSQINLMQKLAFRPNEKWDFQYGLHYSETSEYARYDRHIRYRNGLPRYGEWDYGPQKWMMNNLQLTHLHKTKVYDQVSLRLAYQRFEESRIDRNINENERHIRIEELDAYSANLDFNKAVGAKHMLFYGLEAVYNDVTSKGVDEDIALGLRSRGPSRYPESTWSSYAAYVNYQLKFSEKFLVQAGARYSLYQLKATFDTTFYPFPYKSANINNGALTGSLGVVFRPAEKWVLSASGSTGFRSPNVDDAGKVFDSEPGSVILPNPDLDAEYAYNAEAGIAKIFGDNIKIDVTGYYTLLQNAMVRRDFTFNGQDSILYDGTLSQVQAIQNAAVARVYGIQAGIEVIMGSGFGISSEFNYQKGEEEVDDGTTSPSRHAPPWFGISRFSYSYDRLNLQFYAIYSGQKKFNDLPQEEQAKTEIYAIDENGDPYSPGWYTFNFKAMYRFMEKISVSAGVENITDQRYRPYTSGLVSPGRNFILSLRADF